MIKDIIARARMAGEARSTRPRARRCCLRWAFAFRNRWSWRMRRRQMLGLSGLTPPFAVKVVSREILHKSDVGGVTLNVDGRGCGVSARHRRDGEKGRYRRQAARRLAGRGNDSGRPRNGDRRPRDPQFGPMMMVGLGGIFVEVLKDVAFRICPISRGDAHDMLGELKCGRAARRRARRSWRRQSGAGRCDASRSVARSGLLMQAGRRHRRSRPQSCHRARNGRDRRRRPHHRCHARQTETTRRHAPTRPRHFAPRALQAAVRAENRSAVLGASTTSVSIANTFHSPDESIRLFRRDLSDPSESDGSRRTAGLSEPRPHAGPVDYAYVAIGAERIPDARRGRRPLPHRASDFLRFRRGRGRPRA